MIVNVENLEKRYGDLLALDHLSLSIQEGEIFGLLGPNGSGKTTAINCILSLLQYDQGTVTVFDKPMTPHSYDSKRNIGVVMQNVAVFNELTVIENIRYFCGLYINDKHKRNALVEEAITLVGLGDFKKFTPKKLSGGLLRRLNIACGIAHKPKLIFLDEPTVAVDPQSRNNILEGIKNLNEQGATIVYTSHYMEEVDQLCNRIAIMDRGKIIALGTSDELKAMISTGETITLETFNLPISVQENLKGLNRLQTLDYHESTLTLGFSAGEQNIINVLEILNRSEVSFSHLVTQTPTLNDVFLEITGKALRD